MKNFEQLASQITAVIRENGTGAITGAQLQEVLLAMKDKMQLSSFEGIATPSTTVTTDYLGEHFYIAYAAGTYSNFDGAVLDGSAVTMFYKMTGQTTWSHVQLNTDATVVDSAITEASENPVKSSAIYAALADKADADELTNLSRDVSQIEEDVAVLGGTIPFELGSYTGVSSGTVRLYDSTTRVRVVMPTAKVGMFKITNSDYEVSAFLLYQDSLPTSNFAQFTTSSDYVSTDAVYVSYAASSESGFDPNMCMLVIKRADNGDMSSLTSLDGILGIKSASTISDVTKRSFGTMGGTISGTTGLYPAATQYYLGYCHTPLFIRHFGNATINTLGIIGYVVFYDKDQNLLSQVQFDTTNGVFEIPNNGELYRIAGRSSCTFTSIDISDAWGAEATEFQKLPTDDGYQHLTFVVNVNTCKTPSSSVSEITDQYEKSLNHGVLHLPSTYSHNGRPTPLIIYLHGEADRYTISSTRFSDNNPYAPEWDAAGYAQLDVDMTPDLYGYTLKTGGSSDDDVCVEAAYKWCVEHFNIARDGVYLIGRSRGGQAVMKILGATTRVKMPIVAAISNAGANTLINYEIFKGSKATEWALFCAAHGLPTPGTDGCPSYPSSGGNNLGALVSFTEIAQYLRDNIDVWWNKAVTGLPMLDEYPEIPTINDNASEPFNVRLFDLIVDAFSGSTTDADYGKSYYDWLEGCTMRSPVPIRFDWCAQDGVQQNWETASAYQYAAALKSAFVRNKIAANAEYRVWPTSPENPSVDPHWHELLNFYDGTWNLPNGATITNPSMARLEWLLWCQQRDPRYTGSVQPAAQ